MNRWREGFDVEPPMDAYPKRGMYVSGHDLSRPQVVARLRRLIKAGSLSFVHFGLPCSSWGSLGRLNGGSRRKHCPQGDGRLAREVLGNALAQTVAELCWLLHQHGAYFSIENPDNSYVWLFGPILQLSHISSSVSFDQCAYFLRPPHYSELCSTGGSTDVS